ncbi:TPA: LysR family transcriptional regulator [Corynebacterium striatum]|uniref:LysR family transcriptional regulator n=1 Tax=Corynebacterium striatum TaxID=43770 RepID=UPI003AE7BD7F|nr:LysR family transcriptional regulator [Corynebacterium striatum]
MDYTRAKYFLALARTGSVTAAAEQLGITQPALSRQLRRFEEELELELFERAAGVLRLNEAGKALIPVCQQLVADNNRATQAVSALQRGEMRALQVAATPTTISTILAPFIADARGAIPLLTTLAVEHYEVYQALDTTADVVVTPIPVKEGLDSVPLGEATIRAWVNKEHPLAGQGSIDVEDLVTHRLAMSGRRSVSRGLFDAFVGRSHAVLGDVVECEDTVTLIALARAGRAIAISSALQAHEAVGLRICNEEEMLGGVPLHAAWRSGHFAAAEIHAVGTRLQEFLGINTADGVRAS